MSANSTDRTEAAEAQGRSDTAPWARFDDVVARFIDAPLRRVQEQAADATRDLGERVDKLDGALTGIQDALEDAHQRLRQVATELQAHITATAADEQVRSEHRERIARDLAALRETSGQLATQFDTATVGVEHAISRLSAQILQTQDLLQAQQVKEAAAQTAALNETLRTLHADAETSRERADARIETAIADLRDGISKELAAAFQRSGQAHDAVAARLIRLRLTSYAILAVLIILTVGYLAITLARL
jgi:DNA repair exonuclease SbcCD ATPase subunit